MEPWETACELVDPYFSDKPICERATSTLSAVRSAARSAEPALRAKLATRCSLPAKSYFVWGQHDVSVALDSPHEYCNHNWNSVHQLINL